MRDGTSLTLQRQGDGTGTVVENPLYKPAWKDNPLFDDKIPDEKPANPYVADIGGEKVRVADAREEAEAKAIIAAIKKNYGVKLSSDTVVSAIKSEYGKVPKAEKAKLETSIWEMKELRAARDALAHFAPILGGARKKSSLAKKAQGVTTIGRVEEAIDVNTKSGKVEEGTMGEYFSSKKTVGLFDTVTDLADPRYVREGSAGADNATTLEANGIHEMAHGLLQPIYLSSWVQELDFWFDANTESGKDAAEEPPTQYGHTNAAEDLSESVAIYFVNRPALEATCPKRAEFITKMIASWTPAKKKDVVAKSAKGGTGK
jgi:hypothetical protein